MLELLSCTRPPRDWSELQEQSVDAGEGSYHYVVSGWSVQWASGGHKGAYDVPGCIGVLLG